MTTERPRFARLVVIGLLLASSACGGSAHHTAVHTASNATGPSSRVDGPAFGQSMTRAHVYRSLAQLWGDSTKLVLGDVVGVEDLPAGPDDVPTAKVTVTVRQVLASKPDAGTPIAQDRTVVIKQTGHTGVPLLGGIDILTKNQRYVLFIAPLVMYPGQHPPDWTITGPEAAYAVADRDHLHRLDPASQLPSTIDLDSLVSQAVAPGPSVPSSSSTPAAR